MTARIILGDALERLRELPSESTHAVVTSPAYWGLRKYQAGPQEMGSEATLGEHVERLVAVFREVYRVLRDDGTLWLNYGDVYGGSGQGWSHTDKQNSNLGSQWLRELGYSRPSNYDNRASLNLYGMPERLVRALQADGWVWRSTVVWSKPSPMPESVRGWAWERHYVRMKHENLQGLRRSSDDQDSHPSVSSVQDCSSETTETAIQTNRNLQGKGAAPSASTGSTSEESNSQGQVSPDGQGEDGHKSKRVQAGEVGETTGSIGAKAWDAAARNSDRRAVVGDSGTAQRKMPLLPQATNLDDGSCNSPVERWPSLSGEHRTGLQELQQQEARIPLASGLVPCPGCSACDPNDGLVLRRGSWRPTRAWEPIFMLTKGSGYYSDGEAVRMPGSGRSGGISSTYAAAQPHHGGQSHKIVSTTANLRNVWVLSPEPCNWDFCLACGTFFQGQLRRAIKGAGSQRRCPCGAADAWVDHYAAFPSELPRRCIAASTSEKGVCPACGAPWARIIQRESNPLGITGGEHREPDRDGGLGPRIRDAGREAWMGQQITLGWRATCSCGAGEPIPATILDPFLGTGTTLLAAERLGRDGIGIDLSERYCALAQARLQADAPLLGVGQAGPLAAQDGAKGG